MKVGTFIATMDNAAAIGQKPQDVVSAPDQLTAYMTARVTFLEQLAAQALPVQVLLANFSGDAAWSRYEKGFQPSLMMSCKFDPATTLVIRASTP